MCKLDPISLQSFNLHKCGFPKSGWFFQACLPHHSKSQTDFKQNAHSFLHHYLAEFFMPSHMVWSFLFYCYFCVFYSRAINVKGQEQQCLEMVSEVLYIFVWGIIGFGKMCLWLINWEESMLALDVWRWLEARKSRITASFSSSWTIFGTQKLQATKNCSEIDISCFWYEKIVVGSQCRDNL